MQTGKLSNYQKHLYFENDVNSKEYQLHKCIAVLGLIAKVKDRLCRINNFVDSESFAFVNAKSYTEKIKHNSLLISRLHDYYNYCLTKVNKF